MLIFGLLAIAAALFLAYKAGAHDNDRARWEARQVAQQYAAAMAPSRQRHPSAR